VRKIPYSYIFDVIYNVLLEEYQNTSTAVRRVYVCTCNLVRSSIHYTRKIESAHYFSLCEVRSSRSKSARSTYSKFTVLILELFSVFILINYFH